jgi:putative transposase
LSDGRKGRTPTNDGQLPIELREHIGELPSYGYRRACALVNRIRRAEAQPRVNPKRACRVMAAHGLLLPRAPRRRQSSRPPNGTVAV